MTAPRTPLLVAPEGADDLLGRTMLTLDLVRGLRQVNRKLSIPDAEDDLRTPRFKGITTLWLGPPYAPGSKKICALHLGAIPEWTQLDANGMMITRGWRAIFEKVVRSGAGTRTRIERVFRVNLSESSDNVLCAKCVREGRRERHNGGARHMCDLHETVYARVEKNMADRPEKANRAGWRKTKEIVT